MTVDAKSITLDDVIAAAEERYPHLVVGDVTFRNVARLPKAKRDEFRELAGEFGKPDRDVAADYVQALVLVADDEAKALSLLEPVVDDLAVLATLVEKYFERSQPGEASPSQS